MNYGKKPWATDENKLRWMTFFESALHVHSLNEIRQDCHVSSREYVKRWLKGERVPSRSSQLYIEQMAQKINLKHLLADVLYAHSGINAEQRAATRTRKPGAKKTPSRKKESVSDSSHASNSAKSVVTFEPITRQPIIVPREPKLTMRDMFELATTALPVREHQDLFISTTEKFIAFAKTHRMSLTDVFDLLKTA